MRLTVMELMCWTEEQYIQSCFIILIPQQFVNDNIIDIK